MIDLAITHIPSVFDDYLRPAANLIGAGNPASLQYRSRMIAFLLQRPVLDRNSSPAVDEGVDQPVFDRENLGLRELNDIGGMFGGSYGPSASYRVRMVGTDANGVSGRRHLVSESTVVAYYAKGE